MLVVAAVMVALKGVNIQSKVEEALKSVFGR